MKKQVVIFDFDGVIADSFHHAFETMRLLCPKLTQEHYKKGFEGNIYAWKNDPAFHTEACRHDLDFFQEYGPRFKEYVALFPDIHRIVRDLAPTYALIIISSTDSQLIQEFLIKYEIEKYFVKILGSDIHASKTEKMKLVFDEYQLSAQDCIFITDTLGDIREATHVGIKTIGVTWGFHDRQTLLSGDPYRIIDEPSEIPKIITDYFSHSV